MPVWLKACSKARWLVLSLALAAPTACTRNWYRRNADCEVSDVVAEKTRDPRWFLPSAWSPYPDPRSRFGDPYVPDHPPIPPDDPAAHWWMSHLGRRGHIRGSGDWYDHGEAPAVENPTWRAYLPPPAEDGTVTVTLPQAIELALLNSREYKTSEEGVYLSALALTLDRFAFSPQFFLTNDTFYDHQGSRLAGGETVDNLSTGSLFGVSKLLPIGTQLLADFANSTVWMFAGPNDTLSVSTIDLSLVQPLLRGGGKKVTLEPLTQAERDTLYDLRAFARFRKEFYVSIAAGQQVTVAGGAGIAGLDLTVRGQARPVGYLQLLQQAQRLRNQEKDVAARTRQLELFQEFLKGGEVSGLQVDQVEDALQNSRSNRIVLQQNYHDLLDQFRIQLGLPTDLRLDPDQGLLAPFDRVFGGLDTWLQLKDRRLADLDAIIEKLPKLETIALDDRDLGQIDEEQGLAVVTDLALSDRLDLMNSRARVVDAWRQIDVTANALRGIVNFSAEAHLGTPPGLAQPLRFRADSSAYQLGFQFEAPLNRLAERNTYRASLIGYQRARRNLLQQEDQIKFQVRQNLRALRRLARDYEIQRRSLLLAARQLDSSQEALLAPPEQGARRGALAQATTLTQNLLQGQQALLRSENSLVQTWIDYQTNRLELLRDVELSEEEILSTIGV